MEVYDLKTKAWTRGHKNYPEDTWEHACVALHIPSIRKDEIESEWTYLFQGLPIFLFASPNLVILVLSNFAHAWSFEKLKILKLVWVRISRILIKQDWTDCSVSKAAQFALVYLLENRLILSFIQLTVDCNQSPGIEKQCLAMLSNTEQC